MNETRAPAGWGWKPGALIVLTVDDLPELPFLRLLPPPARQRALTEALIPFSTIHGHLSAPVLAERYPGIPLNRMREVIANASVGRLPRQWGTNRA